MADDLTTPTVAPDPAVAETGVPAFDASSIPSEEDEQAVDDSHALYQHLFPRGAPPETKHESTPASKALYKRLFPQGRSQPPLDWAKIEQKFREGYHEWEPAEAQAASTQWIARNMGLKIGRQSIDFETLTENYFGTVQSPLAAAAKIRELVTPLSEKEAKKAGFPEGQTAAPADIYRFYEHNMTPAGRAVARKMAVTGDVDFADIANLPAADRAYVQDYANILAAKRDATFAGGVKGLATGILAQGLNVFAGAGRLVPGAVYGDDTEDEEDSAVFPGLPRVTASGATFGYVHEDIRQAIMDASQQESLTKAQQRSFLGRVPWSIASMLPYVGESAAGPPGWAAMWLEAGNNLADRMEVEGVTSTNATIAALSAAVPMAWLYNSGSGKVIDSALAKVAPEVRPLFWNAVLDGAAKRTPQIIKDVYGATPSFLTNSATGALTMSMAAGIGEAALEASTDILHLSPAQIAEQAVSAGVDSAVPFLVMNAGSAGMGAMVRRVKSGAWAKPGIPFEAARQQAEAEKAGATPEADVPSVNVATVSEALAQPTREGQVLALERAGVPDPVGVAEHIETVIDEHLPEILGTPEAADTARVEEDAVLADLRASIMPETSTVPDSEAGKEVPHAEEGRAEGAEVSEARGPEAGLGAVQRVPVRDAAQDRGAPGGEAQAVTPAMQRPKWKEGMTPEQRAVAEKELSDARAKDHAENLRAASERTGLDEPAMREWFADSDIALAGGTFEEGVAWLKCEGKFGAVSEAS